ncbi:CDP-glycerol glycerophosphotransferase family protein [Pseudocitrobacter faecalis]|uniref:CDP-glycerol glycerophosphotransferase family protein n=1 Tax=Pseudocitrobacter faecalis TaxID=1398493 RepID=UPI0039EE0177
MLSKNKRIAKFLGCIYSFASALCKKKQKNIIFMSYPDFCDNSFALYKHLYATRKDLKLIWLVNSTMPKDLPLGVIALKKWSLSGIIAYSRAATVFHTHGTYFFIYKKIKGQNNIALWHGMPLKKLGYLKGDTWPEVPYSDFSIATSDFFKKIVAETFNLKPEAVLVTGLPRNDILSTPELVNKEAVLKKIGTEKFNGVIVWLPTYRTSFIKGLASDADYFSFKDEWTDEDWFSINEHLRSVGMRLVIKLHPADILNTETIENKYSNIIIWNTEAWQSFEIDLYDLLSISNGMITDISSVLVDYLLTKKPLAMTGKSIEGYKRGLNKGIDILKQSNIYNIKDKEDFITYINMASLKEHERSIKNVYGEYHNPGTEKASVNITEQFIGYKEK